MDWVSVEERLPNPRESVGYTFDGKNIRSDVYYVYYIASKGKWESQNRLDYTIDEKCITHWMPFPKKPSD